MSRLDGSFRTLANNLTFVSLALKISSVAARQGILLVLFVCVLRDGLVTGFQVVRQRFSLCLASICGRLLNTGCILTLVTVVSNDRLLQRIEVTAWLLPLRHGHAKLGLRSLISHRCYLVSDTVILLLDR